MLTNVYPGNFSNAILEWGKTYLLTPEAQPYLSEIEEYCKTYLKDETFENFLSDLIEDIKKQVEVAIKTLSNPELIFATEDDDIWYEAQESFIAFDKINYLSEVIHHLITPHKTGLPKRILNECDKITSNIIAWLEDGDFSPLRLTILNDIRRKYLARIPENNRYLFPWYEIYSDYDENILRIIMENLGVFQNKKEENIPKALEAHMGEILYELKRDKELFPMLKRYFILHKSLIKSFSKRTSLTLWRIGEIAALDNIVPLSAEDAGIVRVSIKLIKESNISTEIDKMFWTFMVAFCGPGLDEKQRISLLDKVEKMLEKVNVGDITKQNSEVLRTLKLWFDGRCEDSQLIGISFDTWTKMMEEKAANMPVMAIDESPEKLWNAITELQERKICIQKSLEEKINYFANYIRQKWQIFKSSIGEPKPIYGVLSITSSAMSVEQPPRELILNNNPICLSLKPNPEGLYPILSSPEKALNCDAQQDYKEVWKHLGATIDNYWCGCAITKDNKLEVFSVQSIGRRIFTRVQGGKYKKAIIGISPEKALLEEFVQKLPDLLSKQEIQPSDSFITKIIILNISLE